MHSDSKTFVYIELLRRLRSRGFDIYYYADKGSECDFLICNGNRALTAIQVSYDISADKTIHREIAGLVNAAAKTKAELLLLLTDTRYEDIEYKGYRIAIRPVYEFCLNGYPGL